MESMKEIKEFYIKKQDHLKKIHIPELIFFSDTFVCSVCGASGIYKVRGNTKTCPECGGTMYRK